MDKAFKHFDNNTPMFSLLGYKTYGRVVNIHTGNRMDIVIPTFNTYFKFTVKLNNIETCNITDDTDDCLLKHGLLAKAKLIHILTNLKLQSLDDKVISKYFDENITLVWIHCYNLDERGILSADVFLKDKSLNIGSVLYKERLAYKGNLSNKEIKKYFNISDEEIEI